MDYNNKIISLIQNRLKHGQRVYGSGLDINDGRDWITESLEEMLDFSVYISAQLLQLQERRKNDK